MASSSSSSSTSSSSSSQVTKHDVFPSFHGPDVRRGVLSHFRNLFERKEITMFKDQEIERGHVIGSELVQAIREAKASIVLLSKNYASSSWCLDELHEILECKVTSGQIVIPIFYDVDPSDVRKQKGAFGAAFDEICEGVTEEHKRRWTEALTRVASIAGEHSSNWTDEAAMLEKISIDMMRKLRAKLMKEEFENFDIDHDGFITAPELRYMLTKDGDTTTDEHVRYFIEECDVDGDGRISYEEFVKVIERLEAEEAAMVGKFTTNVKLSWEEQKETIQSFMALDVDQNGYITAADYKYVLESSGEKVTDEEVSDFIGAFDIDGDGRVSYDEFVNLTK